MSIRNIKEGINAHNKPGWLKNKAFRPTILLLVLWIFCYSNTTYAVCPGEAENALSNAIQIEQEWPLRPSSDNITQYLQRLGEQLVAQGAALSRWMPNYDGVIEQWHFLIVRDLSVNAFSIGNGWIYLTDGTLAFVNTEAELAAMLSHEIGHQLAGHFCQASASNELGGLLDIFSPLPSQQRVGIGSMMLVIDPVKEQQADQIALSMLRASGYDPHAILEIARRLPSNKANHSLTVNRIQFLERIVADLSRVPDKSSEEFYEMKRRASHLRRDSLKLNRSW